MALHRMLEMKIGVPDPATLDAFYQEIGLVGGERSSFFSSSSRRLEDLEDLVLLDARTGFVWAGFSSAPPGLDVLFVDSVMSSLGTGLLPRLL